MMLLSFARKVSCHADSGIPTLDHPEAMARDHKAISNQRAVLLTNPNVVQRRNNRLSSDVETHAVMNSSKLSKKEKSEFKKAVQSLEAEELSKKKKEEAQAAKKNQSVEEKEAEKIKREKRRLETKEKKAKAAEERENIIENAKKKDRGH